MHIPYGTHSTEENGNRTCETGQGKSESISDGSLLIGTGHDYLNKMQ